MGINRASINIAGTRTLDNDFSEITIHQDIDGHHVLECTLRRDVKVGELMKKCNEWIGERLKCGIEIIDDAEISGKEALTIFEGIVVSVGEFHQRGIAETVVRAHSVSYAMDGHVNTRSFTDMTLQAIVDEVLSPYSDKIAGSSKVSPLVKKASIPYCVQYQETDFDFLNRLADTYGEWFFYDGKDLYFGENSSSSSVKLDMSSKALEYIDVEVSSMPVGFEVRSYDYLKNEFYSKENPEKKPGSAFSNIAFDKSKSKIFDLPKKPIRAYHSAMGKGVLKEKAERLEALAAEGSVQLNGRSQNANLRLGGEIILTDGENKLLEGNFVIVAIDHSIGQGGDYSNSFRAIPKEHKSPPTGFRVRIPEAREQKAKVVDINDELGLGRVKVEFAWQQGTGETSPWLRVLTDHSGKPKGSYFNPELEDLVWVDFEEGDPSKPYVLGAFYHKDAEPHLFDPKNKKKGIRTKGGNYMTLNDHAGHITINAPQQITLNAGSKITLKVGDHHVSLDKDGLLQMSMVDTELIYTGTVKFDGGEYIRFYSSVGAEQKTDQYLLEATSQAEVKSDQIRLQDASHILLKSDQLEVDCAQDIAISATNSVSVSANLEIALKCSTSSTTLSPAMAETKAVMIKLN